MVRQKGLCGRGFGNNNDNVWARGVSMVTQIEEEAQEGDGEGDCSDQLSNDQYHSPTKVPEYIDIKVRASFVVLSSAGTALILLKGLILLCSGSFSVPLSLVTILLLHVNPYKMKFASERTHLFTCSFHFMSSFSFEGFDFVCRPTHGMSLTGRQVSLLKMYMMASV